MTIFIYFHLSTFNNGENEKVGFNISINMKRHHFSLIELRIIGIFYTIGCNNLQIYTMHLRQ